MKAAVHAIAGGAAMLIVATFWTATVLAEVFGSAATVAAVKHAIVYGIGLLLPCMAATGGSGFALGKLRQGRLVAAKSRRMAILAANGVLVMIPAALFLNHKAAAGGYDAVFYAVQAIELIADAIQLTLMGMNARDGFALAGKLRRPPHPSLKT
ncbi:hypothetical protein [Janthinobacterium fluminis]|uniref:Lipoprotein n=1 Tax=Janthinobacterium fluminis TaxID=2987524 RepID=A0ABT5JUQ7_9BURK|nr:hypothetical protein [Janthinobacterium fluminis]MDC8756438.1 hypothetical protein [Janthinobacterium fluminis]